ncbi:protein POOR HOMOLOGOUS SYNAPSIS 1 isoform X2 [Hevea brasiliensis]|uniref:protein POOR HOMOLOGOUS SYNAPSIS 1 isoform X2 n=1 Tax=Hevea brasiliensis TaxID=3981 RepID=UPI0025E90746|nr:protein POOR HOMOLOGOUS SYNAPSIS 1 isoform X2 [Hevea brasiliensis]
MAGSLALVASELSEKPVSTIKDQWQVSFSRFIIYPTVPSTCPSLVPRRNNRRYRSNRGTWISSHSPNASLQLLNYYSSSDAILSVCFCDKMLIQKFALRFSVISEAERFINALKDILKEVSENELLNGDSPSEISSRSVFMSTNEPSSRACEEESSVMAPDQTYSPQLPSSLNYDVGQESQETQPSHKSEVTSCALPPSFASFLTNCCSEIKKDASQHSSSEDIDLKSQIARYMEDSSFQEMLFKVEKVISEIGDGLLL